MRLNLRQCCLCASLVGCMLLAVLPYCVAADVDQEIAARALLGEAEKLNELARPQDALPILDRLVSEYPATEAAEYAELRRAESLMFLRQYDEAVAAARAIVDDHPYTVLGAWAQAVVGESLVRKGNTSAGVMELMRVFGQLPDDGDIGPLDKAKGVIGRVYDDYLKATSTADLDVADALAIPASDKVTRARAYAIIAGYRGDQGRIDLANPILDRLEAQCPGQTAELKWARMKVAVGYLKSHAHGEFASKAVQSLSALAAESHIESHELARMCLGLAEYYRRNEDDAQALSLLEFARDNCASTQSRAEIAFELGQALYRTGRAAESVAALLRIADEMPSSGYAAPALYCAGTYQSGQAAIEAFARLADGNYSTRWRALAAERLGGLYWSTDKARSARYYEKAIELFEKCLAEQIADPCPNWREILSVKIGLLQEELQSAQSETQEVPQ